MALSQRSKHALARLRTYNPPPTQWYNCPLTRRAAVLILLFPDRHGELKVVLTMRSASLNTYAGQAALPGGKSDSLDETPFQTARREAYEEIGLPLDETKLRGFRVEEMCELPTNLAKTELGVRPCVAFLAPKEKDGENEGEGDEGVSVEERLIPRLDPKEVAAVFTAPFHAFLSKNLPEGMPQPYQKNGRAEKWYRGSWTDWHESRWRMHNFYIPRPPRSTTSTTSSATSSKPPTTSTRVTRSTSHLLQNPALAATGAQPTPHHALPNGDDPRPEPNALDEMTTFRVFGMTARILVDAARVAYGEEPEFEHNSHHGDEEMIARLLKMGRLSEKRERGEVLTKEVLKAASKM